MVDIRTQISQIVINELNHHSTDITQFFKGIFFQTREQALRTDLYCNPQVEDYFKQAAMIRDSKSADRSDMKDRHMNVGLSEQTARYF